MTLNEMIDRVRFFIDEDSESNFPTAQIIQSLNVGQDEVQSEINKLDAGYFQKPAEINPSPQSGEPGTTPGVDRYVLPEDFISFKRVENLLTREPFLPIDINELTTTPNGLASLSVPNVSSFGYYASGNDLVLDPVPQSAVRVRMTYIYRVPRITTTTPGTYVSEIPVEFHDMICVSAAIDCKIKDEAITTGLERKWARHRDRLQATLGSRQLQEPKMVGGSKYL